MGLQQKTITDKQGRNYEAWVDGKHKIIIGPPEDLVESLGLPEPFATRLHNALHARRLLNYQDVSRNSKSLIGALQETLLLDAQTLTQKYFEFSQEAPHE